MNCKNTILFALAFLLFSGGLNAQKNNDDKQKSDEKVEQSDDLVKEQKANAKNEILNLLKDEKRISNRKMTRIARGFAASQSANQAEYWYSRFINKKSKSVDLFRYAEILQSKGKCEDAVRWFGLYKEKSKLSKSDYEVFLENCSFNFEVTENKKISIYNLESINSNSLDYSAIPYQKGIVFTSTRNEKGNEKENSTDLFFALRKDAEDGKKAVNFEPVSVLDGNLNDKKHDGIVAFNSYGTQMFLTQTNKEGRKGNLKIYASNKLATSWSDPKELAFNSNRYSCCHPSISADNKRLYFASDMPGGFGEMDIYVCEFKDGQWKDPVNLGPTVNSEKADVFPFISADNTLYFASVGHQGIGGLDIYKTEKSIFNDEYSWNERTHLGIPINSEDDDFAFYIGENNESGFFSSNRKGGKGGDDIYAWEVKKEGKPVVAKKAEKKTDKKIATNLPVPANTQAGAKKKNTDDAVDIPKVEKIAEFTTERNLDIGNNLYITLKPEDGDNKFLEINNNSVTKPLVVDKNAAKAKVVAKASTAKGEAKLSTESTSAKHVKSTVATTSTTTMERIKFALLRDIYHESGKYTLENKSIKNLDAVSILLLENPTVQIIIESHTDSNGNAAYNKELSQRRAENVRNYLITKGVAASRITAVGFGETRLKNHCKDGVKCSEVEHLENRRTEMKVKEY